MFYEKGLIKIRNVKSNKIKPSLFLILGTLVVISVVTVVLIFKLYGNSEEPLGKKAVGLLYSFETLEDLQENDSELQSTLSEEDYEKLTVTNSERALGTYLKFKKNPVAVEFIRSNESKDGGYVLYTLKSDSLSEGRKFVFLYDLVEGNVSNVREMECIDFIKEK